MTANSRYSREKLRLYPILGSYTATFSDNAKAWLIGDIQDIIRLYYGDMEAMSDRIDVFCLFHEQQVINAYAYQFANPPPGDNAGSFYSSELWDIFHTLNPYRRPFVEADYALSVHCLVKTVILTEPVKRCGLRLQENPGYIWNNNETEAASSMGDPLRPVVEQSSYCNSLYVINVVCWLVVFWWGVSENHKQASPTFIPALQYP